jgi:hypothetical protein
MKKRYIKPTTHCLQTDTGESLLADSISTSTKQTTDEVFSRESDANIWDDDVDDGGWYSPYVYNDAQ